MTVKQRALPVRSYSINQRRNRFMFVRAETYIARCEGVTQRARRFRYCSPSLSSLSINHRSADKHHIWLLSPLSSTRTSALITIILRHPLMFPRTTSAPFLCAGWCRGHVRDERQHNLRPCEFVNKSIETRFYFTINMT